METASYAVLPNQPDQANQLQYSRHYYPLLNNNHPLSIQAKNQFFNHFYVVIIVLNEQFYINNRGTVFKLCFGFVNF